MIDFQLRSDYSFTHMSPNNLILVSNESSSKVLLFKSSRDYSGLMEPDKMVLPRVVKRKFLEKISRESF